MTTVEMKAAAPNRYLAYLREHAERVLVVHNKERKELSDDEFSKKKAYIVRTRDGRLLAAFPPRFMKTRFSGFEGDFKRMRGAGEARCDDHLQTKLRVRQRDGKDKQDWLYAFYIPAWPLQ